MHSGNLPSQMLQEEELAASISPTTRQRLERVAWGVLVASFLVFTLLAVGAGLLAKGYWETAMDGREAQVTVLKGTVLVRSPWQQQWVSASSETRLKDGDYLRTDGASQAFVTLFDYSTLVVFPGTEVQAVRLASTRFTPPREFMELVVTQGKVHVGVAPVLKGTKSVQITTDDGTFRLEEGSYTISVLSGRSQLRVAERGRAQVLASGESLVLYPGQRVSVGPGGVRGPLEGPEELVNNGDFARSLDGWQTGSRPGFKEGTDVLGRVSAPVSDGRTAAHFVRKDSKNTYFESSLIQEINRDVEDFVELRLSLDILLSHQSLSGGGYLGIEYPLWVRVNYLTVDSERTAGYGFYYQNIMNNRTDDGTPVAPGQWVKFLTPDNFMTLSPPPRRILSVQIGASGWDYESLVTNVSLVGR